MKEHKRFAVLSSGALAAAIGLVVWIGVGGATPVAAATVFDRFKDAIQRSLTIRMEGIDLGTVAVDGQLVLNRSPNGSQEDALYAEVHVLMRADNRDWNDLDAVLVIRQTADDAWTYCRGNGGTSSEPYLAEPTEYLTRGESWDEFVDEPLRNFGDMPLALGFSSGDSHVTYRFRSYQRDYVEQLLRFLLSISRSETAGEVMSMIEASADTVDLQKINGRTYVLTASGIDHVGDLGLPLPSVPDVDALLKDVVWQLTYDSAKKQIVWQSIPQWPEQLHLAGIAHDRSKLELPTESAEALIAHFKSLAREVIVEENSDTLRTITVVGYPLPTSTAPRERRAEAVPALMRGVTLTIHYDAEAQAITWAEFRGVGSPQGRIILEIDRVELDPARLSPEYWVTSDTADTFDLQDR